jgi:hypothetical protein
MKAGKHILWKKNKCFYPTRHFRLDEDLEIMHMLADDIGRKTGSEAEDVVNDVR